ATASVIADKDGQPDGYSSVSDLFFVHGHAQNNINQFTDYAFSKLIINGGEKIPNFAFAGIPVKEIDISGTKVEEIGEYAFLNCAGFENIALPDSVKTIRNNAFENCTGLAAIELNDGLESIGTETFKNCTGLNSLTVPDTVTSMGTNMLNGCFNLEELTIPYAATQKSCTDAEGVINGYSSVSDLFVIHGHLENNNSSLAGYPVSRITVTGGEKIPAFAFSGFSSLKEIDLSHTNAESVGDSAFYNCSSAKNIILPETVTSVDKNAFANANADIYIYNPECTVSEKAFSDDYSGTIHGLTESAVKTLSDSKEYKFDALDDEIIIGPVNITLQTGETYKINSNKKDLKFTSSDAEVVSVSDDGILTAGKEGKASVEVKAAEDQSSSMNIWVRNPFVTEAPAVTEPAVTTTEAVTTSVTETEASETTPAEAVTTTVVETVPTTVTTTEPVTTTAETTVTSTEPVTTTAETTVTTETTTEAVTTAAETTVTTVTSTEAVTTAVETTVTTVSSTEAVTTAAETTAASETEPAVTDSDPSDTDIEDPTDRILFNITSLEEFSEWAKVDYSIRTGKPAAEAVVIPVTAKYYKIEIKDENGNILDTYSINPKIGIGTTSNNEVVNLPQTGNNSRKNLFTAFAALLMTVLGAAAMKFSGIFDRRRKSDK
ncbi:MAG: leucine-rich repeat protein, partial [Oscillospiraceae bacterium]|nr:leucine-rich repeat protein [Oscillospiraceae bacterium]